MNEKEFRQYVYEERRQGRSDSQIARSLGMSLKHMIGRLNGVDVDKIDPPKTNAQAAKDLGIKEAPVHPVQKPEVKPVSGAKQPEKHEKPKKEKSVDIPKVEKPKEEKPVEDPKEEKPVEDLSWME